MTDHCDFCHELADGTEQQCAFGERGIDLLLHRACQQRILARYRTIGESIIDLNGDRIE